MTRLEAADLVVIAARVLDLPPATALDLVDLDAAAAALAEAGRCGHRDSVEVSAAALLAGLVRHRPLARGNRQVALAATLQLLALHGLDLDLDPPAAARDLVDRVAAGTVSRPELVAWIAARLRQQSKEDGMLQRLTRSRCGGLGPFEHLTGRARQAVTLAQDQARSLGHNYLGTEHLLLGLLVEGHGIAFRALDQLEVSAAAVRAEVEMIIGRGPQPPTGPIAFTPRTKKALELAWCEAKRLGHDDVGTEHLLLGLVREGEGLAAQVLHRLGVDRAAVIEQVMRLGSTSRPRSQQARRTFILDELAQVFDQNEQLAAEVERLQALLRRHGIPDGGSSQTA